MKTNKTILSALIKTTQTGQLGIRCCLNTGMRPSFRKALENQLRELGEIESEARSIACQRGWEIPELDPAHRVFTGAVTRLKLRRTGCESRIADLLIQANTKGMIQGLRNLHSLPQQDHKLQTLSQKLLDCETANIRQMQNYL